MYRQAYVLCFQIFFISGSVVHKNRSGLNLQRGGLQGKPSVISQLFVLQLFTLGKTATVASQWGQSPQQAPAVALGEVMATLSLLSMISDSEATLDLKIKQ